MQVIARSKTPPRRASNRATPSPTNSHIPTTMAAFVTPIIVPRRVNLSPLSKSVRRVSVAHKPLRHATMCTSASTTTSLETFLRAAGDLGTLRFIAISDGAVLETIGRLDYPIKQFSLPKGQYLSIASVDTTFECHINLSKVKTVTMSSEKAKMGDHQLHVVRLLGDQGNIVLSMLLQWDPSEGPGHYLHGAEDTFQQLQRQFGSRFSSFSRQMSRPTAITLEDCQSLFYLPVAQAAHVLGVSRPTISKVLRAHGIKRWPYRKLRAEGKIEQLRRHRETLVLQPLPVLPPPPVLPPLPVLPQAPPPLPPVAINHDNQNDSGIVTDNDCANDQSVRSEPLFPQHRQSVLNSETHILHILDRPISPGVIIEDDTHPFLDLNPELLWTCEEHFNGQDTGCKSDHTELQQAPSKQAPPVTVRENREFDADRKSHTTSTVRPASRAVIGSGTWSHGVFTNDGDKESFAFLPTVPGSSFSDEEPTNSKFESQDGVGHRISSTCDTLLG